MIDMLTKLMIIESVASILLAIVCYHWGYQNGREDEINKRNGKSI